MKTVNEVLSKMDPLCENVLVNLIADKMFHIMNKKYYVNTLLKTFSLSTGFCCSLTGKR